MPDAPAGTFMALGKYDNLLLVVPSGTWSSLASVRAPSCSTLATSTPSSAKLAWRSMAAAAVARS
jgi:hypothetical protein